MRGNINQETEGRLNVTVPSIRAYVLPWENKFSQIGFMSFCALAATIATGGSMVLVGLFVFFNDIFNIFSAVPVHREIPSMMTVIGNIIFAPVVETALMIALLRLFVRIGLSPIASVVLSAVIWAFLHGTLAPLRFAGTMWSFLVFGYSYFLWSRRQPSRGFGAASLTHSYVNILPTALMFVQYYALPSTR